MFYDKKFLDGQGRKIDIVIQTNRIEMFADCHSLMNNREAILLCSKKTNQDEGAKFTESQLLAQYSNRFFTSRII